MALGRAPARVSLQDTSYSRQRSGKPPQPKQPRIDERAVHLRLGVHANLVGGEDLSADRFRQHSGRGVHGLSLQIIVALGDLARVDADADLGRPLRIGDFVFV
jgi:hypothetical protein